MTYKIYHVYTGIHIYPLFMLLDDHAFSTEKKHNLYFAIQMMKTNKIKLTVFTCFWNNFNQML